MCLSSFSRLHWILDRRPDAVCHQGAQNGTPVRCDCQGTPCTVLYPSLRPFRHQQHCLLRFEVVRVLLLAGPVYHHAVPFCATFVSATGWRVQFHPRCTKLQHLCNPFWQVAVHTLFGGGNGHAWRFAPRLALVATLASTRSGTLPVNRPLCQGPGNQVQLQTVVFSYKIVHTCNK